MLLIDPMYNLFLGTAKHLQEAQYFLLHTIALLGDSAPISDLLACLLWPMIRQKRARDYFGKPVEVWCNCVFEPEAVDQFCLASTLR